MWKPGFTATLIRALILSGPKCAGEEHGARFLQASHADRFAAFEKIAAAEAL